MAATHPTPRAPSRLAMSANVETGRVALVLTLEFHATSRAACTVFSRAAGAPASRDGAVHAHYTSTLGSLSIAFTVTSP